jgi:3-oxoacyl-[acyl-carrier protein] reductase
MKGRTALVTGASRGIGRAITDRFRREGANVLAPTRQEMDLSSNPSMDAYLAAMKEPVDIVVNNAGINRLGAGTEASDLDIQETMQINLMAPLRLVRSLAPTMMSRRYGRIVNISSIWSMVTKARRVTYSSSKAGLNGMTRTLAVELAPFNVLVNAVAPGYVNTEMTRQNNSEEEIRAIGKTIPLQRLAQPEEIAEFVSFLCSSRNTYMTGQVLLLDGGFSCL